MLAPTGTVTLVFTDLRASERLWAEIPDVVRSALRLHDKVLREAMRLHGGYEVKSENGAFMIAFGTAHDALEFVADAQRRLLCADWSQELLADRAASVVRGDANRLIFAGLRVSMGAHCGDVECRIDPNTGRMDYFGPTANRAARLAKAAHEGQILVSESLQAGATTSEQWTLHDLGLHRLRGLERPLRLFEVKPSGLEGRRFPPPQTLDATQTNLSARRDRFIGHHEQLEQIAEWFAKGRRLITLTGVSGLGKTRLALRFGGLHLDRFEGGVWFCDLSEAKTLSDIISQVGYALSIPLTTGRSDDELLNQIGAQLGERANTLPILDNLEQVIDPAARAIERWLSATGSLCVLATSQERLRLSAETVSAVRSLSVEEGVELFCARARSLRSDFEVTVGQRELLEQIMAALDCMPLAIELAAAQIRHMSVEALAHQLQQRLDLLSDTISSEHPARHQTLRAAIEWSWNLLSGHEKDALRQASVFRGGFSLDAAEAVIEPTDDDAPWVLDLLESLQDKSLLLIETQQSEQLRFSIYETVRLFAHEALTQADPKGDCEGRHADYFAQEAVRYSAGLYGPEGATLRRELIDNLKNLDALCSSARATPTQRAEARYAQLILRKLTGPLSARRELLEAVGDELAALEPGLRGKLLRARAEYEAELGELNRATKTLEEALNYAQSADDLKLEGQILGSLGLLHRRSAEVDRARSAFSNALNCARRSGDSRTLSATLNNLAALEHDQARFARAEELFIEAMELCISQQHELAAATSQLNLGTINLERGLLDRARAFYAQALATFEQNQDQSYTAIIEALLGLVELDQGQTREAKNKLDRAAASATVSEDLLVQTMSECWHGVGHWLEGEDEAAYLRLRNAAGLMKRQKNPKSLAFVYGYYGAILAQRGRASEAREKFRLGRYLMQQSNNRNHLDALKVLVGVAAAALAREAHEAGDTAAYERHRNMATQRFDFAFQRTPNSEAFPNGLIHPAARSADVRLGLCLLKRALSELPDRPGAQLVRFASLERPVDALEIPPNDPVD